LLRSDRTRLRTQLRHFDSCVVYATIILAANVECRKKYVASAQEAIIRLFMQTPPPSDRDLDFALRRYNIVLVRLAVVPQMTWTKTQSVLALSIGL
jgi:hypothetical protein